MLGIFCLFCESFFSGIFWLAFHGSFRFNIVSFWLNLLPFGLFLFFFLVWPLLSLVEHMNNLWVTIIKIACTIWLIMVTYERHEQSYLSQNGFRQFPVSSQNIWQLQYNYWTTRSWNNYRIIVNLIPPPYSYHRLIMWTEFYFDCRLGQRSRGKLYSTLLK